MWSVDLRGEYKGHESMGPLSQPTGKTLTGGIAGLPLVKGEEGGSCDVGCSPGAWRSFCWGRG